MPFDPRLVITFVAVAEELNFTRAAERLGMSTSSLKVACRRLGLARWPRAACAAHALGGDGAVSLAYSRRLYRMP